jgi:hypothetical protein
MSRNSNISSLENSRFSILTVYIYVEEIIDIVQHENHVDNYSK